MEFKSADFEKRIDKHYNYGYEKIGERYVIFENECEPGVKDGEKIKRVIAENVSLERTDQIIHALQRDEVRRQVQIMKDNPEIKEKWFGIVDYGALTAEFIDTGDLFE